MSFDVLQEHLPPEALAEAQRLLYGGTPVTLDQPVEPTGIGNKTIATDFVKIHQTLEPFASAGRSVTIAAIQFAFPSATTAPVAEQRAAAEVRAVQLLDSAGQAGAQVACLQEAWPMPFAFCTREKVPWTDFAESAGVAAATFCISHVNGQLDMIAYQGRYRGFYL